MIKRVIIGMVLFVVIGIASITAWLSRYPLPYSSAFVSNVNAWEERRKQQAKGDVFWYSIALAFSPSDILYRNRGVAFLTLKDYEQALSDFGHAIKLEPKSPDGYFERANTYIEMGKLEDARKDYDEAVRVAPESANAYCARAKFFADHCNPPNIAAAERDWNKAVELDPKNSTVLRDRASFYSDNHMIDKAIADYKTVTEINDWDAYYAWSDLADLYHKRDGVKKALQIYDEALKRSDGKNYLLTERGDLKEEAGDLQGALQDYNKAIDSEDKTFYWVEHRAQIHDKLKNSKEARADRLEAVRMLSEDLKDNPDPYDVGRRGDLYLSLGEFDKAKKDYLSLKDPDSHPKLAGLYFKQGEYDDAIAEAQKAIAEDKEDSYDSELIIARAYAKQRKMSQALDAVNHLLTSKPDDGDGYYVRSLIYRDLKRDKDAKADYKKAKELGFENEEE